MNGATAQLMWSARGEEPRDPLMGSGSRVAQGIVDEVRISVMPQAQRLICKYCWIRLRGYERARTASPYNRHEKWDRLETWPPISEEALPVEAAVLWIGPSPSNPRHGWSAARRRRS